jgi:hypothetical protein
MDIEKLKERVKAKVAGEKPAAGAEPDGDEGDDEAGEGEGMRPGAMALKAIKAGDSAALEEAIKRCVEEGY